MEIFLIVLSILTAVLVCGFAACKFKNIALSLDNESLQETIDLLTQKYINEKLAKDNYLRELDGGQGLLFSTGLRAENAGLKQQIAMLRAELNEKSKGFDQNEIKVLISLCHPDKHGNSSKANDITAKLLNLKGKK